MNKRVTLDAYLNALSEETINAAPSAEEAPANVAGNAAVAAPSPEQAFSRLRELSCECFGEI